MESCCTKNGCSNRVRVSARDCFIHFECNNALLSGLHTKAICRFRTVSFFKSFQCVAFGAIISLRFRHHSTNRLVVSMSKFRRFVDLLMTRCFLSRSANERMFRHTFVTAQRYCRTWIVRFEEVSFLTYL